MLACGQRAGRARGAVGRMGQGRHGQRQNANHEAAGVPGSERGPQRTHLAALGTAQIRALSTAAIVALVTNEMAALGTALFSGTLVGWSMVLSLLFPRLDWTNITQISTWQAWLLSLWVPA